MDKPDNGAPSVNRLLSGLGRHLLLALLFKVAVLTGIWHVFIKSYRVTVDAEVMGHRMAGPSIETNRENHHDRPNGR